VLPDGEVKPRPGSQLLLRILDKLEDSLPFLVLVKHGSRLPTMHSAMNLYPINGAAHRVGRKDTAFSYREATWAEVIVGVSPDPAKKEYITTWAKEYWDALHPYSAGGAYVNFMMNEGENQVKDSYRDNYDRLATVKTKFDPTNFFRVNQNIQPAS
jgi:FAD/FMN-containing dehydrogenase